MAGIAALPTWLAMHFAVGLVATWLARRYAVHRDLIDHPGERRSHGVATPRGGGISIAIAMLLALAIIGFAQPAHALALGCGAAGLALVAAIGWIDDHQALSPWFRLVVHGLAGGLLAAAVHLAGGGALAVAVAFVAAVVLVNVWNFMDGIDGLAATQAAIAATGYALLAGDGAVFWLGLALAAAICGFLPFNLPRARIFLGDAGSGTLGYALAGLLALGTVREPGPPVLGLLLPLVVFVVDASLTLGCRILRKERWWEPHVQHVYQRWARRAGNHLPVTGAYGVVSGGLVALMLGTRSLSAPPMLAMMAAVLLVVGAAWAWLRTFDPERTS